MILAETNQCLPILPSVFSPAVNSADIKTTYALGEGLQEGTSPFNIRLDRSSPPLLALVNIHDCPVLRAPFEEKNQPISKEDVLAVRTVIEGQIEALRNGDFARAFSYVGPTIQSQYGDAQTFIEVVKTAYEPIFDSHSVVFEDPKAVMGLVTQPVLLLSSDGEMVMASYLMEKLDNGDWKINGCYLAPVK